MVSAIYKIKNLATGPPLCTTKGRGVIEIEKGMNCIKKKKISKLVVKDAMQDFIISFSII